MNPFYQPLLISYNLLLRVLLRYYPASLFALCHFERIFFSALHRYSVVVGFPPVRCIEMQHCSIERETFVFSFII